jgi:cellulose synthase operon protein C
VKLAMHCEKLHAFADGELPLADVASFQEHLGRCAVCQAELRDVMLLEALCLGLAQTRRSSWTHAAVEVAPPSPARRPRPAPWVWKAGMAAAAASIAVVVAARRGAPPSTDHRDGRPFAARLAGDFADRHRPLQASRRPSDRPPLPLETLARLQTTGDEPGQAAVYLMAGMVDRAEAHLARGPRTADADINRAVLAMHRGRWREAKGLLDVVLAAAPDHPQARWNMALVREQLGELDAAARDFDEVAAHREPGWAAEAAARARALRHAAPSR